MPHCALRKKTYIICLKKKKNHDLKKFRLIIESISAFDFIFEVASGAEMWPKSDALSYMGI